MEIVRRLRGLLGIGVSWGALWGLVGAGIGLVIGMVDPVTWQITNPIVEWALGMGAYGAVSGIGFGALLSLGEARKSLRELSLGRVALWGVLGSAAVPLVFGALGTLGAVSVADVVGAMVVTAALGGTFAAGSVAVARNAELSAGEERGLLKE